MALTKIRQEQGVVINDGSTDVDFRVESNGNANMLVIDGGDDVMSIGAAKSTSATVKIQNKDDANTNTLDLFNDNGNRTVSMQQDTTGNAKMKFQKNDGTVTTTIDANLGGILFGTDTAAANTLSDYEEGTHDVAITMGSGTCALYANYNKIRYIKIGNVVTIQGQIRVESVSSPSGAMSASMPFSIDTTEAEGSNISGSLVRTYLGNAPTGGLYLHGTMVYNTGAYCELQWSKSGSATIPHVPVANEYLVFNFTYNTA